MPNRGPQESRSPEMQHDLVGPRGIWLAVGGFGLLALGTAMGVLIGSSPVRRRMPGPGSVSFSNLIGPSSITWYAVAICAPLIAWMVRRYPIDRRHWKRSVPLYVTLVVVAVMGTSILFLQLNTVGDGWSPSDMARFAWFRLMTESLPFAAMIAVLHALEFYRRARVREIEASRLANQLTETRLEALAGRLQPHFLFNTLQSISTLIHRDPDAADRMLAHLSDVLRHTLTQRDAHFIRLEEELAILEEYVAIWRARFPDRLRYEVDAPNELSNALVPFFILQPLVENAFQHGIARRAGDGVVRLDISSHANELHVAVTDDGPGLSGFDEFPPEGVGLGSTRARLEELYGLNHNISLADAEAGGFRVTLCIPLAFDQSTARPPVPEGPSEDG